MSNDALGQASVERQRVYYMDPTMAWEQRLALAHDEALQHIRGSLQPGTVVDLAKYELCADLAGGQMNASAADWIGALRGDRDASDSSRVRLETQASKDYYLGHFAQASANLGAFLTGHARKQIVTGGLTQADFDSACNMRLRAFSDIIHAGRIGALPALLGNQAWAAKFGTGGGDILLRTQGAEVSAPAAGGLGAWQIAAIAIVCVLLGAGLYVAFFWTAENVKQRRLAFEICQDAINRGHPDAATICGSMADIVKELGNPIKVPSASDLIPKSLQDKLLLIGGIGLVIAFGPTIMASISKTQEVYASEKIRRLKALEDL